MDATSRAARSLGRRRWQGISAVDRSAAATAAATARWARGCDLCDRGRERTGKLDVVRTEPNPRAVCRSCRTRLVARLRAVHRGPCPHQTDRLILSWTGRGGRVEHACQSCVDRAALVVRADLAARRPPACSICGEPGAVTCAPCADAVLARVRLALDDRTCEHADDTIVALSWVGPTGGRERACSVCTWRAGEHLRHERERGTGE